MSSEASHVFRIRHFTQRCTENVSYPMLFQSDPHAALPIHCNCPQLHMTPNYVTINNCLSTTKRHNPAKLSSYARGAVFTCTRRCFISLCTSYRYHTYHRLQFQEFHIAYVANYAGFMCRRACIMYFPSFWLLECCRVVFPSIFLSLWISRHVVSIV